MTILYNPATPDAYPRSVSDFRAAFPGLAVGNNPRDEDVAPYGWRVVAPTALPAPGPDQQLIELPPVEVDGQWQQAWQLVDLPPPPPPADWLGFAGWLNQFPPIAEGMASARAAITAQGEPATTGLPVALQEARLAQNYPAWAATWWQFLAAADMPPASIAAIAQKATDCNLPAEFIATLKPASPA